MEMFQFTSFPIEMFHCILFLLLYPAVKCESPSLPPNVQPIPEKTWVYGDRLTHSCREGYISRGDLSISCHHDGQWTNMRGQCSSKLSKLLLYLVYKCRSLHTSTFGIDFSYDDTFPYTFISFSCHVIINYVKHCFNSLIN